MREVPCHCQLVTSVMPLAQHHHRTLHSITTPLSHHMRLYPPLIRNLLQYHHSPILCKLAIPAVSTRLHSHTSTNQCWLVPAACRTQPAAHTAQIPPIMQVHHPPPPQTTLWCHVSRMRLRFPFSHLLVGCWFHLVQISNLLFRPLSTSMQYCAVRWRFNRNLDQSLQSLRVCCCFFVVVFVYLKGVFECVFLQCTLYS